METFSEVGDDSSFIVLGSQTEESEIINPAELYQHLPALNNNNNNEKMVNAGNGTSRLRRNRNGDGERTATEGNSSNQNGNASSSIGSNNVPQPMEIVLTGGGGGGAGGGDAPEDNDLNLPGDHPDVGEESEEDGEEEMTSEQGVPTLVKVGEGISLRTPGREVLNAFKDFNQLFESESETGLSDAPTAIVCDTDGEGEVKGHKDKKGKLLSSETSSMSDNATSSADSELETTIKLRPSSARMMQPPRRLKILSTQEMADIDNNDGMEVVQDDDDRLVLTPADHFGSLHFSGQNSNAGLDSANDSDVVPPSQDYGIPYIVPSSPTATDGPSVSYRSPRSRRHLRFPSMSPRRQKQLVGGVRPRQHGNGEKSNENDGKQPDSNNGSTSNTTTQAQQWAPSASLSFTASGQQGGSSDSNEENQNVPPVLTVPADKTDEAKPEEEKTTDEETTQASVALMCPVHGIKEETVDSSSQNLNLQLSQSQGWMAASVGSNAPPKVLAAETLDPEEEIEEREPLVDPQEPRPGPSGVHQAATQGSQPPTSSVGDQSRAADSQGTSEQEADSESPSQPRFKFDPPTFEEVPEASEKEKNFSVFKKVVRKKREAETKKLAMDSSSGDDPYAFQSQPSAAPGPIKPRKRKLESDSETERKKVHMESSDEKEQSEKKVLGPPTFADDLSPPLHEEFTGLRHGEADSVSHSKVPGEALTPQEAMRSFVMDSGSSEDSLKQGGAKSTQAKPRFTSNSAPAASGSKKPSKPKRPGVGHSADEDSDKLKEVRALRENARRRYQALHANTAPNLVQSPQMVRFMESQAAPPLQDDEYIVTTKQNLITYTTYKVNKRTGKMDAISQSAEIISTTVLSDDGSSPVSSKSSHPSIASGELADISSLSRSSGEQSSGSFTSRPAVASNKSPTASSSYNPSRQSIRDYMKRLSTVSAASTINQTGDDVPLHRRRTISDEEHVDVSGPRPSTSAQADQSSDARSVAPSEAMFSTPPSGANLSVNKTTSTSSSSLPCAQPLNKSRTSESSAATSGLSLVLSPTRVSVSPSDAVKDRATKSDSFGSSRSRSSSGKSALLFSDTFSSHHSSETSKRSDDGVFRVPSIPIQSDKSKQKEKNVEQATSGEGEDTIIEEGEESLTPQAPGNREEATARPPGVKKSETVDSSKVDEEEEEEETEKYVVPQHAKTKTRSIHAVTQGSSSKGRGKKSAEEKSISAASSETPTAAASSASEKMSGEEKGYPVYAQWRDKYFYPGHMTGEERGGRYKIRFEDGDFMQVKENDIILVDLLPAGQEVFAETNDTYVPASVLDHVEEGNGYLVKFTDDSEARVDRAYVIMSPDQAKEFVRLSRANPGTPQMDAANVSLDNLVEGKRKRVAGTPTRASSSKEKTGRTTPGRLTKTSSRSSSSSTKSESTSSTKKGSTAKKGRGRGRPRGKSPGRKVAGETTVEEVKQEEDEEMVPEITQISDISGIEESGEQSTRQRSKRKLIVEPKATSTPTPQKRRARITSQEELAEPLSPLEDKGNTSPIAAKRSPRKSKLALSGDSAKGPIPAQGSQLFLNMKFLLTHVDKMDARRPTKGRPSDSNTDESTLDVSMESDIPFDKDYLSQQIEAGSGTILDAFDVDEVTDNCFCISDSYQRTLKYLHCLAANIRCISHVWIHNSCSANKILDYKSYVLPAGFSFVRQVVIEQNLKKKPFAFKTVLISSNNLKFQNTWTDVLISANCKVLHTLPSKNASKDLLVAVADKTTTPAVITKLNSFGVSIVSSEWIIQCLISGDIVSIDGHPRYTYNFEPPEKSL